MSDTEDAEIRLRAWVRDHGHTVMPAFTADVASLIAEVERLRCVARGYEKAKVLMDSGMESQCERMDELKQRCRTLEGDNVRNRALLELCTEGDRQGEGGVEKVQPPKCDRYLDNKGCNCEECYRYHSVLLRLMSK